MTKVVKTCSDKKGMYYTLNDKRINTNCKPMSMNFYLYCTLLHDLPEEERIQKIRIAQQFFVAKGDAYTNILKHFEDAI